jgi:transcription initiation factor IIE alpha subunit
MRRVMLSFYDDFYRIPADIVTNPYISDSAKILYAILLFKYVEARKNNQIDDNGRVFISYAQSDMACDLHKSDRTIRRLLNELTETGLIGIQTKHSPGENRQIYII